jgi:hypothetical protein
MTDGEPPHSLTPSIEPSGGARRVPVDGGEGEERLTNRIWSFRRYGGRASRSSTGIEPNAGWHRELDGG